MKIIQGGFTLEDFQNCRHGTHAGQNRLGAVNVLVCSRAFFFGRLAALTEFSFNFHRREYSEQRNTEACKRIP